MGIGDWGLGIGDWGLGLGPPPQSQIPNPQSPIPNQNDDKYYNKFILKILNNLKQKITIIYKKILIINIII